MAERHLFSYNLLQIWPPLCDRVTQLPSQVCLHQWIGDGNIFGQISVALPRSRLQNSTARTSLFSWFAPQGLLSTWKPCGRIAEHRPFAPWCYRRQDSSCCVGCKPLKVNGKSTPLLDTCDAKAQKFEALKDSFFLFQQHLPPPNVACERT